MPFRVDFGFVSGKRHGSLPGSQRVPCHDRRGGLSFFSLSSLTTGNSFSLSLSNCSRSRMKVSKALEEKTRAIPGAKVENNRFCVSVHFRRVDEKVRERNLHQNAPFSSSSPMFALLRDGSRWPSRWALF